MVGERLATVDAIAGLLNGRDLSHFDESDPGELAAVADEHGVATLVWQALARTDGPAARVREQLDARARGAATRDLLVQGEMRRVLDAIAAAGGRAVVFKGSALAYTMYDQPWHRPRTDTDLLTTETEMPSVSEAIRSCGYAQTDALSSGTLVSHQIAFERTDIHGLHHVVDLHWKVVNPQVLADVLRFDEIWSDACAAPSLGPAARVPSLVASVILGCVHRLAHHQGLDRLIWLYDLKLLAERFSQRDWESLCEMSARRRVSAICLDGLRQAHQRLGASLPAAVASRLEAAGTDEPSRRYVDTAVHKRDVLASDLAALPGWGARFRLLREHAFPPSAFVLRRYGRQNRLWLPALYAHRLVTGAYRWIRP
jgi:hypothetical protein